MGSRYREESGAYSIASPQQHIIPLKIKARKNTTQITSELYQAHNSGPLVKQAIPSSPISIMDNSQQKISNQEPMNLTQQIRKVNKIQIKKRFNFPESLLLEGKKHQSEGNTKKSLEKFLEYIKIQPLDFNIHYQIGLLYL